MRTLSKYIRNKPAALKATPRPGRRGGEISRRNCCFARARAKGYYIEKKGKKRKEREREEVPALKVIRRYRHLGG
jgi:hypothetical protein